ncbi:hypothetical protein QA645_17040 [Bradyrhizobium sp. CIAT3101]|uniref:hypothetical protein n=1 Tax=Bradyrhizobium sp. CIAT3101 TaxID=439387 RepID=UPI0024B07106|nr:hypothetical protein [Bradyrhizobium sp. CIAT3101]WFU84378.1 hypothetical protein QA645_17040 [Bradyrhizobium sp. CIAT3101]
MTAFNTYSTGTVSIGAGATSIVGSGVNWSGVNAKPGDDIVVAGHTVIVLDVVDSATLSIDAWPYSAVTAGATYKIVQRSPLRFAGGQAMSDVSTLVGALETNGFYVFVPSTATVPDPSYGNDGQYAFQASTGKLWVKSSGAWSYLGVYKGFNIRGAYDNGATYAANDVVYSAGSSYIAILATTGNAPPNATYWQLLASIGNTGATGPTGASYGGTSTTSIAIGTGSKVFTTQAGLAYTTGARVRASSGVNWLEGVATYSGTTLTITSDKTSGSGTLSSWTFNVAGQPGTGDLSSGNNLSDVANTDTALSNLHGVNYNASQSLTASQQAQARANIGVPVVRGYLSGLTLSTAGGSASFSVAAGVAVDSTNVDLMTLASAMSKTYAPFVVGSGNGSLDTGSAVAGSWYHVFQIKNPTTQAVDILSSLSATAPTMPSGYTLFRRIGAMKINLSGFWIKFFQFGDKFLWDVPVADAAALAITTSVSAITLTVPPGVIVDAILQGDYTNSSAAQSLALVYSPNGSAQAAGTPAGNWTLSNSVTGVYVTNAFVVMTNTSAQISAVAGSASGNSLYIITNGWVDTRGRLS